MKKHQFTRPKHGAGDFAPFFDWVEPEQHPPVYPLPDKGLIERISAGCEGWMERGGLIVANHFGVKTVKCVREKLGRDEKGNVLWGKLSGVYEEQKQCCPLAPLLDGLPSRFNPLADFALVLNTDHFWVIGFMHGVDKTNAMLTGRRTDYFEESLTYVEGRDAGVKIAERYVKLRGGWDV
jgi:hypothetical protein